MECILLDIVMPGLSGNETCRRIKDVPELRNVPLLMLTSLEAREAMMESLNAGADDYIPKASDFEVIRARVRAALRRKQFEDESRGVREQLLRKELEAAEARAQRELAETRASLLSELREREVQANIAAEAADLGVWYWNVETDEHAWSNRYRSLFSLPPEIEPSYEEFLKRIHPDDRDNTDRLLRQAVANRGEYENECRIIWPDGSMRSIVLKGRCLSDDGRRLRMTGVAMDVTDRKLTQEAMIRSEKLASAGRMAATIAHEINNPLEAVMNAVYLAWTDKTISREVKASLDIAVQELKRVAHITQRTLGFYRERTIPSLIDVRAVVDGVLEIFSPRLKSKGIVVEKRYRGADQIVAVDGEMRQIVSNLLSNSFDATPSQGKILLRVTSSNANGSHFVRFTIADTGTGILRERMPKIFEPFYTTKEAVGTGLGLWVTKELVQKHGGAIRVRSKVGSGTVFSITFPVATETCQIGIGSR